MVSGDSSVTSCCPEDASCLHPHLTLHVVNGETGPHQHSDLSQAPEPWVLAHKATPSLCPQCYVNLLFWYQFLCGFSGSTMIDYWQMIFFNLFFTSLPPLVFGILDKDISAETLLALPELYKSGQDSEVRGSGRWAGAGSFTAPWRHQSKSTGLGVKSLVL